jgi:photosystem II stability/assembly factor-like uncharacterized protein
MAYHEHHHATYSPGGTSLARFLAFLALILLLTPLHTDAQGRRGGRPPGAPGTSDATGLTLRPIGPAVTSGRVVAFAVDPADPSRYFVAAGSGGVWKTTNAGTSWTPVFDNEGSYSIGALALDPKNPNVVWVGTGELNAQRSVGYGDGVYRSDDGGKTWRNLGLKASEHIARIVIDPADSDTVYVAAQGPLWGPGGDRGLFKTTDGGRTWKNVLAISANTGVTDVVLDPRNPEVLYAASWQRRRHVFTYIGGGPESGIHKSTDGGATWTRLRGGLPAGDLGRIGLALSPADPNLLYATVEAAAGAGGTYCSTDFGASWEKRSDFVAQGMYYGQIVADPKNPERIYLLSVTNMVSDDGGRTTRPLGESAKHVDNHALWVEPANTRHLLAGCDGGVYDSFDRGATWLFKSNLPLAQFYRIAADNSLPFYYVYGGTQDNNSVGGPSHTRNPAGITNADWFVTAGGDGFHQQVDPQDPNTVYSESQDGGLVRFDRRTGLRVGIQPLPGKGEPPLRWYWDSPVLISPHSHTRLYFGGNILFRSDDRGNTWRAISPDLTRQVDRNQLPVMGKIPRLDAVARGQSTSFYGNIIALTESPKQEGLIYVGTDDGLIQVTEDGGKTWRKITQVPGVPEMTYVGRLLASQHDASVVYALFDNHKNADFAPYVMRSVDRGRTWTPLANDLPKNGPALSIAEDHVSPDLLFLGTEFGLFHTVNGGKNWTRLRGGLPTIAVRDLVIQKRENDLVVGTFGRGIYILDDYASLRPQTPETQAKEAVLLPVKTAIAYVPYAGETGAQGETHYAASNPPYGATFTYRLKAEIKTLRQKRQEAEREAERKGQPLPFPTAEALRVEAAEDPPATILTVTDSAGNVVRRLTGPVAAGTHRVTWDLRGPGFSVPQPPAEGGGSGGSGGRGGGRGFGGGGGGFQVMPGDYRVSLARRVDGILTELVPATPFSVAAEGEIALKPAERKMLAAYREKVARLQRAVLGAVEVADSLTSRLAQVKLAVQDAPGAAPKLREETLALERRLRAIDITLRGDSTAATLGEPSPPSVVSRVSDLSFGQLAMPLPPTQTRLDSYRVAAEAFSDALAKLRALVISDLPRLDRALDAAGVPHTPGRLPNWKDD